MNPAEVALQLQESDLNQLLDFLSVGARLQDGKIQGQITILGSSFAVSAEVFSDQHQLAFAIPFDQIGGSGSGINLLGAAAKLTWPVWKGKFKQQCRQWETQWCWSKNSIGLSENQKGILLSFPFEQMRLRVGESQLRLTGLQQNPAGLSLRLQWSTPPTQ